MTTFNYECQGGDGRFLWVEMELEVTSFDAVPPFTGSPHLCDSDEDYRGYTEIEWQYVSYTIFDQDGGEVEAGMGEPSVTLNVNDDHINEWLIEQMEKELKP